MKTLLRLLPLFFAFYSCDNRTDYFIEHEWILHYNTYDDNLKSTHNERVVFRNDSILSYSKLEPKAVPYSLEKTDSTIIFRIPKTIINENTLEEYDTLLVDTAYYDFKNVLNTPILALTLNNSLNTDVLFCSDKEATLIETNNFIKLASFKIGGYTIGDSIDVEHVVSLEDCIDILDCEGIINAKLRENRNVSIQLIDKKFIYSIKQDQIGEESFSNIVDVVNQKLKISPDTLLKKPPFYTEGLRWQTGEIEIKLSKNNMAQYYLDEANSQDKTVAGKYMKQYYLKLANNETSNSSYYTLEYNNSVIQSVLKYKNKSTPVSTIIE